MSLKLLVHRSGVRVNILVDTVWLESLQLTDPPVLVTYFREFCDLTIFLHFAVREFRECRPNRENKFSRKLVLAKISTRENKYL